jgi:hypothetical protein
MVSNHITSVGMLLAKATGVVARIRRASRKRRSANAAHINGRKGQFAKSVARRRAKNRVARVSRARNRR